MRAHCEYFWEKGRRGTKTVHKHIPVELARQAVVVTAIGSLNGGVVDRKGELRGGGDEGNTSQCERQRLQRSLGQGAKKKDTRSRQKG